LYPATSLQAAEKPHALHAAASSQAAESPCFCIGHEFAGSGKAHALYQGTTLVVPKRPQKDLGFTGCGKSSALYQGTTLVVP
jgi:hypothetical protein